MIRRFLNFIEENELFSKEDHLLLGFSGGADSVALFHLLRESNFTFSVAHVNYSLRDKESEGDALFVRSLCDEYNIECFVKKIEKEHWKTKRNIQAEAREIRYTFFNELKKTYAFTKVLTAHHKDDNIESILMNIARGTGLKGLLGIEKKHDDLVRPLLFIERSEIEEYLNSKHFQWRNDSSNLESKYKRNRFRNKIIPLLNKENPSFTEAMDRLLENLAPVAEVYYEAFDKFKKEAVFQNKDEIKIDASQPDLLRRFLFEFIQDFGFNSAQTKDILKTLNETGRVFNSSSHRLYIDRAFIIIVKEAEISNSEISISESANEVLEPVHLVFSSTKGINFNPSNEIAVMDKSKLHFPLKLRHWKHGDRIQPLGMKGMKKISDILIDKKISLPDKSKLLLLLSNDEVIWIVGMMLSDKVKIRKSTQEVWKCELIRAKV
jgi:tRNA(Ile)-lysidine synthase